MSPKMQLYLFCRLCYHDSQLKKYGGEEVIQLATMKDVGALAKVGVGTVSRVLNSSGSCSESTRRKVEAAMKELNYIPNAYARGLKMNKTNTVT